MRVSGVIFGRSFTISDDEITIYSNENKNTSDTHRVIESLHVGPDSEVVHSLAISNINLSWQSQKLSNGKLMNTLTLHHFTVNDFIFHLLRVLFLFRLLSVSRCDLLIRFTFRCFCHV